MARFTARLTSRYTGSTTYLVDGIRKTTRGDRTYTNSPEFAFTRQSAEAALAYGQRWASASFEVEVVDLDASTSCKHCEAEIEWYPGTGWVDTLSGDEGGTYDNCPRGIDAPHQPKEA